MRVVISNDHVPVKKSRRPRKYIKRVVTPANWRRITKDIALLRRLVKRLQVKLKKNGF